MTRDQLATAVLSPHLLVYLYPKNEIAHLSVLYKGTTIGIEMSSQICISVTYMTVCMCNIILAIKYKHAKEPAGSQSLLEQHLVQIFLSYIPLALTLITLLPHLCYGSFMLSVKHPIETAVDQTQCRVQESSAEPPAENKFQLALVTHGKETISLEVGETKKTHQSESSPQVHVQMLWCGHAPV